MSCGKSVPYFFFLVGSWAALHIIMVAVIVIAVKLS
jgi:hypothetical protein